MLIFIGIIFALLAIAGLIVSLIFSKKKLRIIIIAINCVVLLFVAAVAIIDSVDKGKEEEESYEYVIHKGTILADVTYNGNIDGYECVNFGGLFNSDNYIVSEENVTVSSICKVYKSVKVYSEKNKSFVTGGEDSRIKLSNGMYAYEAENIRMIKPDYGMLVLMSCIFGALILGMTDIVFGIVVLIVKSRASKYKK